jgi:hypothetical protein
MDIPQKDQGVPQEQTVKVMMKNQLGIPTQNAFAPVVLAIVHVQVIKTSVVDLKVQRIPQSLHVKQPLEHSVMDLLAHQHILTQMVEL